VRAELKDSLHAESLILFLVSLLLVLPPSSDALKSISGSTEVHATLGEADDKAALHDLRLVEPWVTGTVIASEGASFGVEVIDAGVVDNIVRWPVDAQSAAIGDLFSYEPIVLPAIGADFPAVLQVAV